MFAVQNFMKGITKGNQGGVGGNILNVIGGLIPGQSGGSGGGSGGSGGGGGGGLGGAGGMLGGIINMISDAAANYKPEPPPPARANFTNVEANESDEVRQFRRLFMQLAGDDMEVCPTELMNILNKVVTRHQDLRTEGFTLDSCRSMVAVMDNDATGKLGFEQFKYLWNNIKKWQCIFKRFDQGQEGFIRPSKMPAALQAAGFQLHEELQKMLIRRYGDEEGNVNFDSYISSHVRLDSMFRAFKALDRDMDGQITVNQEDWLKMTMYS